MVALWSKGLTQSPNVVTINNAFIMWCKLFQYHFEMIFSCLHPLCFCFMALLTDCFNIRFQKYISCLCLNHVLNSEINQYPYLNQTYDPIRTECFSNYYFTYFVQSVHLSVSFISYQRIGVLVGTKNNLHNVVVKVTAVLLQ